MFVLYNLLLTLLSPIWVPWMLWRAWRRKEQPNWKERSGDLKSIPPKGDRPRLWVHAVSVGEVVAARPILREIRRALPDHEVVLSVTTSSGHRTAREGETGLFDHLIYFPIDVARFQLAAMQRVRPDAVVIMETEMWMNFLWAAKVFEARTLLANGRISDRAYPRDRAALPYFKALLQDLDRALMQSEVDAERIRSLGASRVEVFGNCKFDQALEAVDTSPTKWRKELGIPEGNLVLVIGSTRAEEEEFVLDGIDRVGLEGMSVIHAPRHLESAPGLIEKVRSRFGQVAVRSNGETGPYLVLDTYGELAEIYSAADLVVIGGGFANLGGQNIVQPLAMGKPVIHGPYMQNFREPAKLADEAGAASCASTPEELASTVRELLADKDERDRMGKAAKQLVATHAGASRRYVEAIVEEIREHPQKPRRKPKAE